MIQPFNGKEDPIAMAKAKTVFQCAECGSEQPKWAGQCPDCGSWNSLQEKTLAAPGQRPSRGGGYAGKGGEQPVMALSEVSLERESRLNTEISELDRVLGGGLVSGSVVLIGGDPGIGKSTLLLQVMAALARQQRCLYVTGEESLQQVGMRAQRLGLAADSLRCLSETRIESILAAAEQESPHFMVIDSIQTVYTEMLTSAPGSVAQVRESAAALTRFAKRTGTAIVLVGHVTKEGALAGPRVLEHMVDAVLYFEGDSGSRYRVIRAMKNRFGAVNELGVFAMTESGLKPVSNPSAIFLSGRAEPAPGSVVMVTREGTRPMLVEVQALVDQSPLANPRRLAVGLEQNRLALLLAVMHRHGGIAVFDQDVFINVVGGIRVAETAADLPIAMAVLASLRNRALPKGLVVFGEVGLSGEIRPVYNGEERLREAAKHGFDQAIVPRANAPKTPPKGLNVIAVDRIDQALEQLG